MVDVYHDTIPGWDKVIYIAGPFSDPDKMHGIEANILAASRAALDAWRAGWAVICPHKNSAGFQHAADLPYEVWTRGDLAILSKCDAILLMQQWDTSPGARKELIHAVKESIPVYLHRPSAPALRRLIPVDDEDVLVELDLRAREIERWHSKGWKIS